MHSVKRCQYDREQRRTYSAKAPIPCTIGAPAYTARRKNTLRCYHVTFTDYYRPEGFEFGIGAV